MQPRTQLRTENTIALHRLRDGYLCDRLCFGWHPLQYSCLENPMDGGAWKAAVHGVAEGRT